MDLFVAFGILLAFLFICSMCRVCCKKRTSEGMVITTPVTITSEVHRVAGTQALPSGVVVQGHTTGTAVFPPMPTPYPVMPGPYPTMPGPYAGHQPYPAQPYPAQPYPVVQQYATQSPAPVAPPNAQFPPLPPSMHSAPEGAQFATAPPASGPPMANPPSYEQVMTNAYAPQAPYNPDYKGH